MTEDERATFVKDELATIGTFYDAISATFTQLVTDGKDVFIPDPVQVGDDIGVLKMPVDTKKTPDTAEKTFTPEERLTQALKMIEKIKEQGEGTSTSPEDVDFGDELSHYYRFSEIVQGYRYIPKTEEVLFGDKVTVWKYEGAPIKFPDVIAFPKLSTKGNVINLRKSMSSRAKRGDLLRQARCLFQEIASLRSQGQPWIIA